MEFIEWVVKGKDQGFQSIGFPVKAGEELLVTADDEILFCDRLPGGYPRDPDGRDRSGRIEIAERGWPAPGLVQNSLVLRVDVLPDLPMQGGRRRRVICPAAGRLQICNNDNDSSDNQQSWRVRIERTGIVRALSCRTIVGGRTPGWTPAGFTVKKGDQLWTFAAGTIDFGFSQRAADGRNKNGIIESAPTQAPAPGKRWHSLVLSIGGVPIEPFGADPTKPVTCPEGAVYVTNNDERPGDNSGQWTIQFCVGPPATQPTTPSPEQVRALNAYRYQPTPAPQLAVEAQRARFVDNLGRSVVFRGVNFGGRSKFAPYLPIEPFGWKPGMALSSCTTADMAKAITGVAEHLDQLRMLGFNCVRIPVIWRALEPQPSQTPGQLTTEATHYLDMLKLIVDALWARGLSVFLDFHQDLAHERFGGDGFPDWAMQIDAEHPELVPGAGFNNNVWVSHYHDIPLLAPPPPGYNGQVAKLVRATLSSFWANSVTNLRYKLTNFPVQDHLVGVIGQVARHFRGHPAIIGYEPFNEPHQAGRNVHDFEARELPTYYAKVHREIRKHDATAFIFVEPRVDWTTYDNWERTEYQGTNFTTKPRSFLGVTRTGNEVTYSTLGAGVKLDNRVVFSFHHYDPWIVLWHHVPSWIPNPLTRDLNDKEKEWPATFEYMGRAAAERALIPFLTELGADQSWTDSTSWHPEISKNQQARGYMDLQLQHVEKRAWSSTYWNYNLYNSASGDNWNTENFSLLGEHRVGRNLDVVARVYALRAKGGSSQFYFNPATHVGAVTFKTREPINFDSPAVIYVPSHMHYPNDQFVVHATAKYVRWDAQQQLLYWLPVLVGDSATLIVRPAQGFRPEQLPSELQNVFPHLVFTASAAELTKPVGVS